MQTNLSLVVVVEAGHDPVKATGILLAQLSGVCNRSDPRRGQVWKLRTVEKRPHDPWEELARLAAVTTSRRQSSGRRCTGSMRVAAVVARPWRAPLRSVTGVRSERQRSAGGAARSHA
jgi:hypothetical protein